MSMISIETDEVLLEFSLYEGILGETDLYTPLAKSKPQTLKVEESGARCLGH